MLFVTVTWIVKLFLFPYLLWHIILDLHIQVFTYSHLHIQYIQYIDYIFQMWAKNFSDPNLLKPASKTLLIRLAP